MEISHDITFTESDDKILAYNYKLNKACIINKSIYNFLINYDVLNLLKNISDKEQKILLKNGMIFQDNLEYDSLSFSNTLLRKQKSINLRSVYLHVTQTCNLRCSYCYNGLNLHKSNDLTLTDITDIANSLNNVGAETIIITGGEPLLRKDILDICKMFKKFGFKTVILTNGTLISERQEILNFVDKVIISVDTFEQMKNVRNGLDVLKLRDDLLSINNNQRGKISLRSVITHSDEKSWKEVKGFATSNGFNYISSVFIPNNCSEICLIPSIDKIEVNEEDDCSLSATVCGACYREIAINFNGDIYPCQALIKPEFKISNVLNSDWQEDLRKSQITSTFLRRTVDNVKTCSSCNYRYLCGGGCPAVPYNLYGSLLNCAEPLCIFHKTSIENKLKGVLNKV